MSLVFSSFSNFRFRRRVHEFLNCDRRKKVSNFWKSNSSRVSWNTGSVWTTINELLRTHTHDGQKKDDVEPRENGDSVGP